MICCSRLVPCVADSNRDAQCAGVHSRGRARVGGLAQPVDFEARSRPNSGSARTGGCGILTGAASPGERGAGCQSGNPRKDPSPRPVRAVFCGGPDHSAAGACWSSAPSRRRKNDPASPAPTSPGRGRDRGGSAPRSHRRREERCRPLRPAVCAVAGADPPVASRLPSDVPSACAGAAASGTFFRKAFDSCERLMRTPSRASISARRRGIVQLRRSVTGSSSKGAATRKAASLFTGGGPGAMLAFSAATPPAVKSLRQRRTVSSRTPNASAILGLVQPASVSSTARPVRLPPIT